MQKKVNDIIKKIWMVYSFYTIDNTNRRYIDNKIQKKCVLIFKKEKNLMTISLQENRDINDCKI